jgi:large repetitive protein
LLLNVGSLRHADQFGMPSKQISTEMGSRIAKDGVRANSPGGQADDLRGDRDPGNSTLSISSERNITMQRRSTTMLIVLSLLLGLKAVLWPTELSRLLADSWTMTGNLNVARSYHTATLLPNGKVLVYGGFTGSGTESRAVRSAELYDPATGVWTFTGSAFYERANHTATLLPNGRVLVAGGSLLKSAELYDPGTGQWYATGPLQVGRSSHTATLLPNGKVLVAGNDSAELYDPVTQVWTPTGDLNVARTEHRMALLPDGKVLVVGGFVSNGFSNSAELYDPATGVWTLTGSLFYDRLGRMHTVTALQDGRALVAGGYINDSIGPSLDAVEEYHPASGEWYSVGLLNTARRYHAATLLSNGKVLVAGGLDTSGAGWFHLNSTEVFDPVSLVWTATADLNVARSFHTMTLLSNGKVLVAGGDNATSYFNSLDSAELYNSATTGGGGGGGGGGGCCPRGKRCCGSCESGNCDDVCVGPGQSCP